LKKTNLIYFVLTSLIVFLILYFGFLYNIYIHPTEILNLDSGKREIILFGDFKYLFTVINCHNLGFDVYSSNDCYKDYYGSFLYGPTILIFPSITKDFADVLIHIISTVLIISFIFLNIKIIKPDNLFKYLLTTLIFFNPTTLFLYEKLNIDILIYIFLIISIYFTKNIIVKLLILLLLTLTKFYPAILSIIFLLEKKIKFKNLIFFFLSVLLIISFFFLFLDNLKSIIGTLDYVSQSFRYSFSLNSLNKILLFFFNFNEEIFLKLILIGLNIIISYAIYYFFLKDSKFINDNKLDDNSNFFIVSSSLAASLYLIFGNNFYREIYLIGIIPFLLNNIETNIFRYILYIFISKYIYLLIFFPYYYNADLNVNTIAQILITLKSFIDYFFISILISVLFLFIKIYINKYLKLIKKNEY